MKLKFIEDPQVKKKFDSYPDDIHNEMNFLRSLVIDTAKSIEGLEILVETLKWDEPSYTTKYGSTLRIDWKPSKPEEYAMYFHCQTKLIDTFKELYGDQFHFEGNRSIVFKKNVKIPVKELKHCISMALNYHKIKHLPLLGA